MKYDLFIEKMQEIETPLDRSNPQRRRAQRLRGRQGVDPVGPTWMRATRSGLVTREVKPMSIRWSARSHREIPTVTGQRSTVRAASVSECTA